MARPNLGYLRNLILFVFGLPCGFLTGLTAIANSVVVMPLLGFLRGIVGIRASGTALAVTFFAAFTGLLSYGQDHLIHWLLALILVIAQIGGAQQGHRLVVVVPKMAGLGILWAVPVIAVGLFMIHSGLATHPGAQPGRIAALAWRLAHAGLLFYVVAYGVAFLVGMASTLVELGGVLLVPALVYGLQAPIHEAQGTALLVLAIASLPPMLLRARHAEMEPNAAVWVSVGAVFGALVGAFYAVRLSDPILFLVYGIGLTLFGLAMLWRRQDSKHK